MPKIFLENLEYLHAKQRTWVIRDYVIKMKKNLRCYKTVMLKHWKLLLIAKITISQIQLLHMTEYIFKYIFQGREKAFPLSYVCSQEEQDWRILKWKF